MSLDAWNRLSATTQLRIATALVRRRSAQWLREYRNLTAVGVGYRLKRSVGAQAAPVLRDEVCICFYVVRKWKTSRQHPQKLPETVVARPRVRGRRVEVHVPTDVSTVAAGGPQVSITNLTDGIRVGTPQSGFSHGCTSALVRDSQGQRYLLTCGHVVSQSLSKPPAGTVCQTAAGMPVGAGFDVAPAIGNRAMDAALVRVDSNSLQKVAQWGYGIQNRASEHLLSQLRLSSPLRVLARRLPPPSEADQRVLTSYRPARFRSRLLTPVSFDYRKFNGRHYVFSDVIEYVADTRTGDSGSAVVDANGTLIGMHFYGDGNLGYAIAATSLFRAGAFAVAVAL